MQWCLYALGGGLGHLVRSLALTRAIVARGHDVTLLANTESARCLPVREELGSRGTFCEIPAAFDRGQVTDIVQQTLREQRCDVLVVDTFPRGLAGELIDVLPTLSAKKVLVHRDLNPRYVEQTNLVRFVDQYDLLLAPGELGPLADHVHGEYTAPWLIRDFDELLDQTTAWQRLQLDATDVPVIAIIAAGFPAETLRMQELAKRLMRSLEHRATVRLLSLTPLAETSDCHTVAVWPSLEAMRGIDLLIGAGGYNTVWEARSTQTPLIAIGRERLYDRQSVRLTSQELATDEADAFSRALVWVDQNANRLRAAVPKFENGTHAAVRLIEKLRAGAEITVGCS